MIKNKPRTMFKLKRPVDERGVSVVLGAALVIGIIITVLSAFLAAWIPREQERLAQEHALEVRDSFEELQLAIEGLERGRSEVVDVRMNPSQISLFGGSTQVGELLAEPVRSPITEKIEPLTCSGDAYVDQDFPGSNYGMESFLETENKDGSKKRSFLKFDLENISSGIPSGVATLAISSVHLKLYCQIFSGADNWIGVYRIENDDWDEYTITWNNQPNLGTPIDNIEVEEGWNSWDVTSWVREQYQGDGVASFCLRPSLSGPEQGAEFSSREGGNVPSLEVDILYASPLMRYVVDYDDHKGIVEGSIKGMQGEGGSYVTLKEENFPGFSFGYARAGSSYQMIGAGSTEDEGRITGSVFTSPEDCTAESITAYVTMDEMTIAKCAIYRHSDNSFVAETEYKQGNGWVTFSFSDPPSLTADTEYVLVCWGHWNEPVALYYDAGGRGRYQPRFWDDGWPDPADFSHEDRKYSIYCIYTVEMSLAPPPPTVVSASPGPDTFGYQPAGSPSTWQSVYNRITGSWFTPSSSGTVTSISAYVYDPEGPAPYKFAIYQKSDNALIGYTVEGYAPIGGGWLTLNVTSGGSVSGGVDYYLVAWGTDDFNQIGYDIEAEKGGHQSFSYGAFPNPWSPTVEDKKCWIYSTYTAVAPPIKPTKPTLHLPSDGAITFDNTPYFEWTKGEDADNHRLLVDNDFTFTSPEENRILTDNFYENSDSQLPADNYSWKVVAINENGENESDTWTFVVIESGWRTPVSVYDKCGETYSGYGASEAIDDNLDSFWYHENTCYHWIIFDMGLTAGVKQVRLYQAFPWCWGKEAGLTVYVSDNTENWGDNVWENSLHTSTWGWVESGSFGKNGRYIKLVSKSNAIDQWMWEFDAYICPSLVFPTKPMLYLPSDGSTISDNTPYFEWTKGEGADNHRLLVDNDSNFTSPEENVLLGATASTYTVTTPLADENYSWKVIAIKGENKNTSATWTFVIDTIPRLGSPTLSSPADGAVTSGNTPTFEWTPGLNADNHRLLVDNDSNFTSPEENVLLGATASTYTVTTPLADENYSWKVIAIKGENENVSATWTFVIDTVPPPTPTLVSPKNDFVEHTSLSITFTWTAVSDPSGVTYHIQIDDEASFTSPYVLDNSNVWDNSHTYEFTANNNYYWRVRAKDGAGNWSEWSDSFKLIIQVIAGYNMKIDMIVENVPPENFVLEMRYRLKNTNDYFRVKVKDRGNNWNYRGDDLTSTSWKIWSYRLGDDEVAEDGKVKIRIVDANPYATSATDLLIDYLRALAPTQYGNLKFEVSGVNPAQTYVYEDGAVILVQGDTSFMVSPPTMISVSEAENNNIRVDVHHFAISGLERSMRERGICGIRVEVKMSEYVVRPFGEPNRENVTVTIRSNYEDIWADYFADLERELDRKGFNAYHESALTLIIRGRDNEKDIYYYEKVTEIEISFI